MESTLLLQKLSLLLMRSGKKKLVYKRVIKQLENFDLSGTLQAHLISKSWGTTHDQGAKAKALRHLCILTAMFHRLKPILETRKVRKASKHYDVPFFLKESRRFSILLRWFVKAIRKQGRLNALQQEIQNIFLETGSTLAESKALRLKVSNNIMFSHYRWK
jgi:small subunit ribosomal protein S7